MDEEDIRMHGERSWKDTAYLYYRLWKSAQEKADKWESLVGLLKDEVKE
jgi:hypothetical protein